MNLGSFLRNQMLDIVQWNESGDGVLAWRYPMHDMQIQYGGSLTVRDSQLVVFVNEGRIADVFEPGMYKLTTRTLPVLTALQNWDKGFRSPFKSDVVFFSTRLQLGRRWGTAQPVTIRDSEFGMVRVRAHGVYSYKVADAARFYREVSGTRERYTVDELEAQLRNLVVATMAETLGSGGVAFLDLAGNQGVMAQQIEQRLAPAFQRYGVALESFAVESVSLPEPLQKALDMRIAIGMSGDLTDYARYQAANAIPQIAGNAGSVAGMGAGLAVGALLGPQLAQAAASVAGAVPPTTAVSVPGDPVARLQQLKQLLDQGLISADDYDQAKATVLRGLTG